MKRYFIVYEVLENGIKTTYSNLFTCLVEVEFNALKAELLKQHEGAINVFIKSMNLI